MDLTLARNFLIALLIGALVGIDREKKKDVEPGHAFGGIRTYMLLALVGGASAWLARSLVMPWVFVMALAVVGAAVVASYLVQNRPLEAGAPGLTSEIAALAVCLLGAMAVVGDVTLAVALGVVTSALLAFKQPLHGLVGRLDSSDLLAGIKLLIASFIVLPLLPNEAVDPWGALNPYELWLLVILISALSLVGYVAIRWRGPAQGTAITGLAGGLVSSTATTLSFARSSHAELREGGDHALAAGVLLSWLVMLARVLVLVAVVNRALLPQLAGPVLAMAVVNAAWVAWHYRAGVVALKPLPEPEPRVANPFSLGAAARVGAVFAVVQLGVKLVQDQAPAWMLGMAALAGLVDVDAITLTLAKGAGSPGAWGPAAQAIAVAVLANTVVKCGLVLALGQGPLRRHVGLASLTLLLAGGGVAVGLGAV